MSPSDPNIPPPEITDEDSTSRTAKALWWSFLGVWLLTMVHYGAVVPWAVAATALAMAALNGLALLLLPDGLKLSKGALAWLAAVAAVFALQLLPLGPLLFPATHAMRQTHGVATFMPGTADLFLTLRSLAQFLAYILAALLVLRLRGAGLSSSSMMKGLGGLLAVQALYGLVQFYAGLEEIPFYGPREQPDSASGSMVNRNTFGGLMAMGTVVAAALAYSRFAWQKRRTGTKSAKRIESGVLWTVIAALFVFGLVVSHSRGAALGAVIGTLMIPFLFKGRGSAVAAIGLVGAGVVAVALADPAVLVERFEQLDPYTIGENSRVRIWSTTLAAAVHQPVLGWGVGSHPYAYHPYQPPDLVKDIRHAHNEYINFFFEGGAVFAFVMLAGLFVWGLRSWRSMQRLPGPDRFLPTAALCAGAAEAVHSVVDFDCRVTTAGLLFAALVGLAAAVNRPKVEPGRKVWGSTAIAAAVAAILVLMPFLDEDKLVTLGLTSEPEPAQAIARRVLAMSPFQYQAAWIVAKGAEKKDDVATAAGRYGVAADLWPAHPALQLDVATWYWDEWKTSDDPAYYDRAARSFHWLFTQRPGDVEEVFKDLWEKERAQAEYEGLMPADKPAAWGALASFLSSKGQWAAAQALFDLKVPSTPENVLVFDRFGESLKAAGQWGMEAVLREKRLGIYSDAASIANASRAWANLEAWDKALERATQACRIEPMNMDWVTLKADIYNAKGDTDNALQSYVLAVMMSPLDVKLLFKRASLYMSAKMYGEAAIDYKQILRSKMGDRDATLGLAKALAANKDLIAARRVLDEYIGKNPADAEAAAYRAVLGQ